MINRPHDPDVRSGDKGVARFITDIAVTSTVAQDNECRTKLQPRLVERHVAPAQQAVDQGYRSGDNRARRLEHGIALRGFVREENVSKRPEFRVSQFDIDLDQRPALCPAGTRSVTWAKAKPEVANLIASPVSFGRKCRTCPFFGPAVCTDKVSGRHRGVSRHPVLLLARRRAVDTAAFQVEMPVRPGIEGAIAELVRAHGVRRARYRRWANHPLHALFIATNLKRLAPTVTALFPALCSFSSRPLGRARAA